MVAYNNSANYQVSQYDVVTGGANNLLNNVPSAASGTVLTSNGVSAQPSYQTAASGAFPWSVVSGTSQTCVVNNGYISSNASQVNMYLPSTAAIGNEQKFANISSGFNVVPAPGQTVSFLAQSATYPSYLLTTTANAALDIVCTNANTSWNVINNEGTFTTSPVSFSASFGVYDLMFLKSGGASWGSGANSSGEIGNQTLTAYSSPVATVGTNYYIQISNGWVSTLALRQDGTAWAWGDNTSGNLGNNTTTSVSSPISVLGGFNFIQVQNAGSTVNPNISAGLTTTGTCWMWGSNALGQLGNLSRTNFSSPISVVGAHSFVQIALAATFTLGLKIDGSCWAWGGNAGGQLGNNTTTSFSSPVSVVGAHSFIQVSCGATNCYGLKIDGSCWAWGSGAFGQLGNNAATNRSSPISVVGGHSFIQVAAGGIGNGYGLKITGDVWSWGYNASGQIGNNTTTSYSSPVSVVGGFSFINLAKGNSSDTMAGWLSNGQLWAWGDGGSGELGNNTTTNTSSPVLVLNTP
jgi:alpha-tubulin suppressor-like RCC1 family protein